jgi:glutaconate CoA-transferase, subunit B
VSTPAEGSFTLDEWFVVELARTIRDRETVFHGFGSPCAQVAMHVAKRTHAPHMLLVEGATYAVNPTPPFIPPTGNDLSLQLGSTYQMRFEEFFDAAARGDVDRMFLSGGQIDAYGNTNVTAIGPLDKPKVKLGGGGGGCNLSATIRTLTLWTTRHRSGRTLIARCDFVTDMGHSPVTGRRTPGVGTTATGTGPERMVTELGVFDFDERGHVRLTGVFPDVEVEDVHRATGFDLPVAGGSPAVPPPPPPKT